MIKMVDAFEVGRLLGKTVRDTAQYREDFVESEEVTDLLLASIRRLKVAGKLIVKKTTLGGFFVLDHPEYGLLDDESIQLDMALVWDHPVWGFWDLGVWKDDSVFEEVIVEEINF